MKKETYAVMLRCEPDGSTTAQPYGPFANHENARDWALIGRGSKSFDSLRGTGTWEEVDSFIKSIEGDQ